MWDFVKPLVIRYLPVAGRYIATAAVGVLAAGLNRVNLHLDPTASAELTAGLGAVFIALAGWALGSTASNAKDATVANAVRAASDSGQETVVSDAKTGETHAITVQKIYPGWKPGPVGRDVG